MEALCSHALSRARFSPDSFPSNVASSEEETSFLQDWDADIKRSARSHAKLAYLTEGEEDDLAQEARIRLLQLYRGRKIFAPNYIRVAIRNSMLTLRSRARFRSKIGRKDIQENNAVVRFSDENVWPEDSSLNLQLIKSEETHNEPDPESCSWIGGARQASHGPIAPGPDFLEILAVRRWVKQLPDNLRGIYEALYVNDVTQREAAIQFGVSQPRIAELHRVLLQRAKQELCCLAA